MPPSNPVPTALDRTRSSLGYLFAGLRWLATVLATGVVTLLGWTGAGLHRLGAAVAGLRGPVVRVVRGPLAALVLGRRAAVSVILAGVAPVLAVLTAGLVATTVGYHPLERWLVGTWTGTDPRVAVFVGAALLVGLAAAGAIARAGLVPTGVLVAAPVFGVAVTRYGTTVSTYGGERIVSLPEAVAIAAGVAAVGSVAVVVVGYPLGAATRRAARIVRAERGEGNEK